MMLSRIQSPPSPNNEYHLAKVIIDTYTTIAYLVIQI